MTKNPDVGSIGGGDCDYETVERSLLTFMN